MRSVILSIFISIFSLGFASVAAASYEQEYKAYNTAIQKGDQVSAKKHAEAAWRAAKQENVDKKTIAVLAYNYGYMVQITDPASAIAPFKEAIELSGGDMQLFGVDAPDFLLAFTEVKLNKDNQGKYELLQQLLQSREDNGIKSSVFSANAWSVVAQNQLKLKQYTESKISADIAIEHFRANFDQSNLGFADVYILAGMARLAGSNRSQRDLTEAYALFQQAVELFPPQTSIETLDPKLALAYAWSVATSSAARSDFKNQPSKFSSGRIRGMDKHCQDGNCEHAIKWVYKHRTAKECRINISDQKSAVFPRSEGRRGHLGAVLVGFHIAEDGRVTGVRILSEAPGPSAFGEAALEAVKQWHFTGFDPQPACTKDIILQFEFSHG